MSINYTLSRNEQYNSLEIIFDGKPSDTVREALKALKFRYHGGKKLWYGYADEQTVRAAISGQENALDPVPAVRTSARPAKGTPQNRVRILYNGMKVDGKLYRCLYSINDEHISVYGRDYEHLPRGFFDVRNDSDVYTDYFEEDYAQIPPEHPFYRFFLYAARKDSAASAKRYIKKLEKRMQDPRYARQADYYRQEIESCKKRIADFEKMRDPGQPTQEDLNLIDEQRQQAENARREAEHREQCLRQEKAMRKRTNGRHLIEEQMKAHPIKEGEPVVLIRWSEHPGFYSWEDNTLRLSVAAAETILRTFDTENNEDPEEHGYDKTSFIITGKLDNGDEFTYEGRYDLGDGEGGMIQHIRSLGEWELTHDLYGHKKPVPDPDNGRIRLADYLQRFIA